MRVVRSAWRWRRSHCNIMAVRGETVIGEGRNDECVGARHTHYYGCSCLWLPSCLDPVDLVLAVESPSRGRALYCPPSLLLPLLWTDRATSICFPRGSISDRPGSPPRPTGHRSNALALVPQPWGTLSRSAHSWNEEGGIFLSPSPLSLLPPGLIGLSGPPLGEPAPPPGPSHRDSKPLTSRDVERREEEHAPVPSRSGGAGETDEGRNAPDDSPLFIASSP